MITKRMTGLLIALAILLTAFCGAPAFAADGIADDADGAGYIVKLPEGLITPFMALTEESPVTPIPYTGDMYVADTLEDALAFAEVFGAEYIVRDEELFLLGEVGLQGGEAQWYTEMIGAESLWNAGYDGAGTTVAIVDSGLFTAHEDFAGAAIGGADFVNYNDAQPGASYEDATGHGTFVAGIVGAVRGNGFGIDGIASGADLLAVRCFPKSSVRTSDVVAAISYAIQADADVINMSFGGFYSENLVTALRTPIERARENGIILVAAAGNEGDSRVMYPAGLDGVIGVGMVDSAGTVAAKSQRNDSVDITAPGFGLTGLGTAAANAYVSGSGTSYAAPVVAALAAIVRQADGAVDGEGFLALLKESADDKGAAGYDTSYGWGLVNGKKLLAALQRERSITYELDGGAIVGAYTESYTIARGSDAELPENVVREGSVFGGWYAEEDFSGAAVTAVPYGSVGDVTYYAKWLSEGKPDLESVAVLGIPAVMMEGATYEVELPAGTDAGRLTADDFEISPVSTGAQVDDPETIDGGSTWTFTVSFDGSTASYIIHITVSAFGRPVASGAAVTGSATPASLDGIDAVQPYVSESLSSVFTGTSGGTVYAVEANSGTGSVKIMGGALVYTPVAADAGKTVELEVSAANGAFNSQGTQRYKIGIGALPPSDSIIRPAGGRYDMNKDNGGFPVSLSLYGNSLTGLLSGGKALTLGGEYAYSEAPMIGEFQELFLTEEFLKKLPVGETVITFQFSGGRSESSKTVRLTLAVTATTSPQTAPGGLGKSNETATGAKNGVITGVTTAMEYKLSTAASYTPVTGTTITGLAPGTYHVRYAATATLDASPYTSVTIDAYTSGGGMIGGGGGGGGGGGVNSGGGATTPAVSAEKPAYGTITTSPGNPQNGDTVTVTVKVDEGYTVAGITVADREGKTLTTKVTSDGVFTFTYGGSPVTVEAQLVPLSVSPPMEIEWSNPFSDVNESAWYYEDIAFMQQNGLMNGTGADTFSPDAPLSRGMIVTILYRLAGSPAARHDDNTDTPFTDTADSQWHSEAIKWAAENGIVSGIGEGKFSPDTNITRQDLAVLLTRYLEYAQTDILVTQQYVFFADEADISNYAKNAIQLLHKLDVMGGIGNNTIDPKGQATRAQAAAMLHRFIVVMEQ